MSSSRIPSSIRYHDVQEAQRRMPSMISEGEGEKECGLSDVEWQEGQAR